jgi:cutinase
MGPIVCGGLKREYPERVGCQGVGPPYTASLMDNVSVKGTTAAAINEAKRLFTLCNTKCPKAVIAFGGYRYVSLFPVAHQIANQLQVKERL